MRQSSTHKRKCTIPNEWHMCKLFTFTSDSVAAIAQVNISRKGMSAVGWNHLCLLGETILFIGYTKACVSSFEDFYTFWHKHRYLIVMYYSVNQGMSSSKDQDWRVIWLKQDFHIGKEDITPTRDLAGGMSVRGEIISGQSILKQRGRGINSMEWVYHLGVSQWTEPGEGGVDDEYFPVTIYLIWLSWLHSQRPVLLEGEEGTERGEGEMWRSMALSISALHFPLPLN